MNITKNEGEGFVRYKWNKPNSSQKQDKISFVRLYEPWGWIIGTGIYEEDIESILRLYLKDNIAICVIALMFSIILVFLLLQEVEARISEKFLKKSKEL